MFKVGQRVWSNKHDDFKTIKTEMEPDGLYNFTDNEWAYKQQLHETADDMFEKLGFEKYEDEYAVIYTGVVVVIFDKYYKRYFVTDKIREGAGDIIPPLHQAIHQKLIEMGEIE